jgi:hypothetical protein
VESSLPEWPTGGSRDGKAGEELVLFGKPLTQQKGGCMIFKAVIALTLLWYLCGCAGTVVKVVPINIQDAGKQIMHVVSTGDAEAELVLLEITF